MLPSVGPASRQLPRRLRCDWPVPPVPEPGEKGRAEGAERGACSVQSSGGFGWSGRREGEQRGEQGHVTDAFVKGRTGNLDFPLRGMESL